jgi:hypothetical protein
MEPTTFGKQLMDDVHQSMPPRCMDVPLKQYIPTIKYSTNNKWVLSNCGLSTTVKVIYGFAWISMDKAKYD